MVGRRDRDSLEVVEGLHVISETAIPAAANANAADRRTIVGRRVMMIREHSTVGEPVGSQASQGGQTGRGFDEPTTRTARGLVFHRWFKSPSRYSKQMDSKKTCFGIAKIIDSG